MTNKSKIIQTYSYKSLSRYWKEEEEKNTKNE